jgi:hypothetical protein
LLTTLSVERDGVDFRPGLSVDSMLALKSAKNWALFTAPLALCLNRSLLIFDFCFYQNDRWLVRHSLNRNFDEFLRTTAKSMCLTADGPSSIIKSPGSESDESLGLILDDEVHREDLDVRTIRLPSNPESEIRQGRKLTLVN